MHNNQDSNLCCIPTDTHTDYLHDVGEPKKYNGFRRTIILDQYMNELMF